MSVLNKIGKVVAASALIATVSTAAFAEKVLRIQSVLPTKADEVVMLRRSAMTCLP